MTVISSWSWILMWSDLHWTYILKVVPYIVKADWSMMSGLLLKGGALHNRIRLPCHAWVSWLLYLCPWCCCFSEAWLCFWLEYPILWLSESYCFFHNLLNISAGTLQLFLHAIHEKVSKAERILIKSSKDFAQLILLHSPVSVGCPGSVTTLDLLVNQGVFPE